MLKQHHYMILLLMEQALAQFCPSTPSLGVPNAVVLFNGSSWSLNTPLAGLTTSPGCNTTLCPGENETNLIVSPRISTIASPKVSWRASTNSSCDPVMVAMYTYSGSIPSSASLPPMCSMMSLSGSFTVNSDFSLGFSLNSSATSMCINIFNVVVWYTYCNATTMNLVQFNMTSDGSTTDGTCVPNASGFSLLQATCSGTTFTSVSACTCNTGYTNVMNKSCQSIPAPSSTTLPPTSSSSSPPVPSSSILMVTSSTKISTTTPSTTSLEASSATATSSSPVLPPSPTASTSPLPSDATTAESFPLAAAIGIAAGGAVLAIVILCIVIIIVCICRIQVNRQGFYETNEDKVTEPTMLRYSASLRSLTSQTVVPIDGRAPAKENEFYV